MGAHGIAAAIFSERVEVMICRTKKSAALLFLIVSAWLLPGAAFALIEVYEGSEPVSNMGWPTGSEEVANHPGRLGYMVGPPFGGGEYYFKYHCSDTNEFVDALEKFSQIRVPRMGRRSLVSLDGQTTQILDDKPLLLVVHDWPKAGEDENNVDWTFSVWAPENFHGLFSGPEGYYVSDHPHYRQPVPPPRIDVYVDNDGKIKWDKAEITPNIRVIDKRKIAAPESAGGEGMIQGSVYDMATYQVISGANVVVAKRAKSGNWAEIEQVKTDNNGFFQIRAIPEGHYEVLISADGYAARRAGSFDNRSGYAFYDFDTLLAGGIDLQGIVVDEQQNPIAGVQIHALDTIGIDGFGYKRAEELPVLTDDAGRFVLTAIPRGYTRIRCKAQSLKQETPVSKLYRVAARPMEKSEEIRIIMSGAGIAQRAVTSVDREISVRNIERIVSELKAAFPKHFLEDAAIAQLDDIERPMVFGEPDPPEGFAGPDPTGKHPFGIYVPVDRDKYFKDDISLEQWILHEMFHLHNRRTGEYNSYIDKAFPDDSDPLVQWLMKDPYHRTFAREEAFINLISFADPPKTKAQTEAIREWFDYIGARDKSIEDIKEILNVIEH